MSEARERLRSTFDAVADVYDAVRPSYPDELFDDLVELAALEPSARLLEIGCGTGQATRPMLERGYSVVCIELGPQLAEHARRTLAGSPVDVLVASFEDWDGDPGAFDLVYAATAWHWLDPVARYEKAHRLLCTGGHLAFWSALHAFPDGFDPFFSEIQDVYEAIGESHGERWPPAPPDEISDMAVEIEASGLFEDVEVRRYVWERSYTADEYVALLNTFSGHITMEKAKREHLYNEIRRRIGLRRDGRVLRHWYAILHVARRAS